MVQMGVNSLIVLALFGIAWGAVPVDVSRMRKTWHAAAVAFAGPAANLGLSLTAALLAVLFSLGGETGSISMVSQFFTFASLANGVLFLFNLLPVPMFDGWTVFSLFVPAMKRVDPQQAATFSWMFLLVVFVTPVGGLVWDGGARVGLVFMTFWKALLSLAGLG
jgi:Zn-dependent protease